MSWKASAYAKEVSTAPNGKRITRSEKLLLLILADYYNDARGCAWPSIKSLASEAMLSPRRVKELLLSLETKRLIKRETTTRDDGGQDVNLYAFPALTPPVKLSHPPGANPRTPPVRNGGDSPYIEQPKEPPLGRAARATTVPSSFTVTPQMRDWAKEHVPRLDLKTETENFLDHHRAKGTTFKDWTAAWRTWMRNALKFNISGARTQAELNRGGGGLVV
jgi:Helix-turn-helix domain